MDVKRYYRDHDCMDEHPDGEYVLYTDHLAAITARDADWRDKAESDAKTVERLEAALAAYKAPQPAAEECLYECSEGWYIHLDGTRRKCPKHGGIAK